MKTARFVFVVCLYGMLAGCAALDGFFLGTPGDPNGGSTAGTLGGILSSIPGGPWTIAGLALTFGRHAYVEIRHQQLIAAGKKDDNDNGIDDEAEKPKPPPTITATSSVPPSAPTA